MALFRRSRRGPREDADPAVSEPDDVDVLDEIDDPEVSRRGDDGPSEVAGDPAAPASRARPAAEAVGQLGDAGPYDRAEVPGPQGRLELGSLWLTGFPGMQLRLEIDQERGEVSAVTVLTDDSAAQIQAFAAPKSAGVWPEIRAEIAQGVNEAGGTASEAPGPWGAELIARLPAQGPDGGASFQPARFIGVDGPRWFLRAVLTGAAATDPERAEPLLSVLRGTVVVRGEAAMAPRELLPLNVPEEVAAPEPPPPADPNSLSPFQRGPEITEIR
jgi:hypothetical protein